MKNPLISIREWNPAMYGRELIIYHDPVGLLQYTRLLSTLQSTNLIHRVSRLQEKIHMTTSTDGEKVLNKIQHPFMIKSLKKLGKRRGTCAA